MCRNGWELILGYLGLPEQRATDWHDNGERVGPHHFHPAGMALADELRALGGFTASELDRIAHAYPEPIHCGSLLALRR